MNTRWPSVGSPLDAGQHRCYVVCRTPSILQNVQAQFTGGVDVGMEHLADELDGRGFVGILFLELHHQSECPIFKGRFCGADYDSIPAATVLGHQASPERLGI